jgi:hypothetical protein
MRNGREVTDSNHNLREWNGSSFASGTDGGKRDSRGKHCGLDAANLGPSAQDLIDETLERVGVSFIRFGGELQQRIAVRRGLVASGALL